MIIRTIEKTQKGKEALIQNQKDSLKLGTKQKAIMKLLGIKQEISQENPYTADVIIKNNVLNKLVNPEHIKLEIINFMESQGAKKNYDYSIEVIQ